MERENALDKRLADKDEDTTGPNNYVDKQDNYDPITFPSNNKVNMCDHLPIAHALHLQETTKFVFEFFYSLFSCLDEIEIEKKKKKKFGSGIFLRGGAFFFENSFLLVFR